MIREYEISLFRLIRENPFYSTFVQNCHLEISESDRVKTAAVSVDKDSLKLKLIINTTFFKSLSPDERVGLLMHEVLHLVYSHLNYMQKKDKKEAMLVNIAADLDVNQNIPENLLPKCGVTVEKIEKQYKVKLKRDENVDYYYNELKKIQETLPEQDKTMGEMGDGMDDHSMWEEVDENTRQQIIKEIIKRTDEECQRKGYSKDGKVEAAIREILKVKSQLSWKAILKDFIKKSIAMNRESTRTRANRRYGLKTNGKKIKNGPRVMFAVDVSGSMSDEEYDKCMAEVKAALKEYPTNAEVVFFDSSIVRIEKLSKNNKMPGRSDYGGTNFDCVLEHANKVKPDGLIFLTDGECYLSVKPQGYRILWILTRDRYADRTKLPGKSVLLNQ